MKDTKEVYLKVKNYTGIYKHITSNNYQARKKVDGMLHRQTFTNLRDAASWFRLFNGTDKEDVSGKDTATLKEVWAAFIKHHFPSLAKSTQEIWIRRYELLQQLEHLEMHKITPGIISGWVERNVSYFKSSDYEGNSRGKAKRCNLDNELNLMVTIFNWYSSSEYFEKEAYGLVNPVKTKHRDAGFIRMKQTQNKAIPLEDALEFFRHLSPMYRNLAQLQYYTASRVGEAAGLQWKNIDFERGTIKIKETCRWDMSTKAFIELNPHPKNKEERHIFMTDELRELLRQREVFKLKDSQFVFHLNGKPLNYSTIQINYKTAQRRAKIPHTGTHMLRHGMATLARHVFGGLDGAIAMTGHKDYKLADHYSKDLGSLQKDVSVKVMAHIKKYEQAKIVKLNKGKVLQLKPRTKAKVLNISPHKMEN